ncbi:MAG: twin-arginine translocase TatA/TatE family subunit [Methylococcales bacterium]|jgi:sec-independent protein translocase protein TatA|nr:twin-arginine translocase TatA/TatE family subunit [Methylococcales bacterium]
MGIGIWQLLIVLLIVLVLFGAKRIKNLGGDLGGAIKNFKSAIKESEEETIETKDNVLSDNSNVIEVQKQNTTEKVES